MCVFSQPHIRRRGLLIVLPRKDCTMHRVNEYELYELASDIHPLTTMSNEALYSQVWYQCWTARSMLNDTFVNRRPLSICRPAAEKLFAAISAFVPADWSEAVAKLPTPNDPAAIDPGVGFFGYNIRNSAQEFETVLRAELQAMDTYFVSPFGTHNTSVLLSQGRLEIPKSLHDALPEETLADFDQAGKCLLFGTSTAAAFHLLRATDAVIRSYYRIVTGIEPAVTFRNWGAYIKRLRECKAEPKIIDFLDHIRENYRNPILHPDVNVTTEEAQVLFGVCVSSIVQMGTEIMRLDAKGDVLPFSVTAKELGAGL
jgi:hypothetical protein